MEDNVKYDATAFIAELNARMQSRSMPKCPFCGGSDYTTPEQVATIPVGHSFRGLSIGQTAPCAMVVCTKCGHVDYFALGMLGILPRTNKEGGQNEQANANR